MKTFLEIYEPDIGQEYIKRLLKKQVAAKKDKAAAQSILQAEVSILGGDSKIGVKRAHYCDHDDPKGGGCTVEIL